MNKNMENNIKNEFIERTVNDYLSQQYQNLTYNHPFMNPTVRLPSLNMPELALQKLETKIRKWNTH